MKILYKTIFWIIKHSPNIIAIPIGKWLQKQLKEERRKRKLDELADFLLEREEKKKKHLTK